MSSPWRSAYRRAPFEARVLGLESALQVETRSAASTLTKEVRVRERTRP